METKGALATVLALCGILCGAAVAAEGAGKSRERIGSRAPKREVRIEGFSIEYTAVPLPASGRKDEIDSAAEIEAILEATGAFKTRRSITYRKAVLEPGTYRLRTMAGDDGKFFFLIEPQPPAGPEVEAKGEPKIKKRKTSKRDRRAMGIAGDVLEEETGGEPPEEARRARGGKRRDRGDENPKGGPDEDSERGGETRSPATIRALFRLKTSTRRTSEVTFGLRPQARGTKLELSVSAGSSHGSVRIGVVPEK